MTVTPRAKRKGELDVFGAGHLDVLSVGRGHLKLTISEGDAVEIEKAKRIITDMLNRGYAIFVEEPDGTTKRVKRFDAKHMTYIVDDTMDTVPAKAAESVTPVTPVPTGPRGRRYNKTKAVPVAGAKATAVAATAGG